MYARQNGTCTILTPVYFNALKAFSCWNWREKKPTIILSPEMCRYKVHYMIMNNLIWLSQVYPQKPKTTKKNQKTETQEKKYIRGEKKMFAVGKKPLGLSNGKNHSTTDFLFVWYTRYKSEKFLFLFLHQGNRLEFFAWCFLCVGRINSQTLWGKTCTR